MIYATVKRMNTERVLYVCTIKYGKKSAVCMGTTHALAIKNTINVLLNK